MNLKQFLLWLPMIPIAILNGGLREEVLDKYFNELIAHQISTISLTLLCTVYTGFIFRFLEVKNARQALLIGFIWVLLTLGFEFIFGLSVGNSLQELLYDYNLAKGRLWSIFLISLFLLPYLFYVFKHKR